MRRKGFKVHRDPRSGAGGTTKTDIKDFTGSSRLAIDCKDQKTLKVKEWSRQIAAAAPAGSIPTMVYRDDEKVMAVVPFADLLDLELEAIQLRAELEELRVQRHLRPPSSQRRSPTPCSASELAAQRIEAGARMCRYGHIADEFGRCNTKGCPSSHGYKPPRKPAR